MGEPLARADGANEGVLVDAAHRLENALQTLETVLARPRAGGSLSAESSAHVVELEVARQHAAAHRIEALAAKAG